MASVRIISIMVFTIINWWGLCAQDIVINEIMSSNTVSITDEDGDFEDWIELYNPGDGPVSISGWSITDDISEPEKWVFPEFSINPKNFILVFASGKDRHNSTYFHSNFKIKASGEALFLFDMYGILIDSFPAVEIESDKSFGRFPDAGPNLLPFYQFSPWNSNNESNVLNKISGSHTSGFYGQPFYLTINSNRSDSIFYTLNGSEPHPGSSGTYLFQTNIEITSQNGVPDIFTGIPTSPNQNTVYPWSVPQSPVSKGTILRAQSYRDQKASSNISSFTYFVSPEMADRFSFPVISIILDSIHLFANDTGIYVPGNHYDPLGYKTGNYYMTGKFWERKGFVEMFSENGETVLSQECGIRTHGNLSREYPQKSLRLYARKQYGKDNFDIPGFTDMPETDFKRIVLRTPLTSHEFTMFKDPLIHQLAKGLNIKTVAYTPTVVFLNGEYWGIHNLRERIDGFFYKKYFGIDIDNLDQLSGIGDVNNGDSLGYMALMQFVEDNTLSVEENFQYVSSQIDMENYIDYYIIETYFANLDWPGNNYEYWRSSDLDNKWRWQLLDMDATFGGYENNMFERISAVDGDSLLNPPWSTLLFRGLIENEGFRESFVNRYEYVSRHYFSPERIISIIDEFEQRYETEMAEHIHRWNLPEDINTFHSNVKWMRKFARKRPCIVKYQLQEFFNIEYVNISCNADQVMDSIVNSTTISIYPNPAKDKVHIKIMSGYESPVDIKVLDLKGQLVHFQSFLLQEGENKITMDLPQIHDGLYLLKVITPESVYRRKLLVKKN